MNVMKTGSISIIGIGYCTRYGVLLLSFVVVEGRGYEQMMEKQ